MRLTLSNEAAAAYKAYKLARAAYRDVLYKAERGWIFLSEERRAILYQRLVAALKEVSHHPGALRVFVAYLPPSIAEARAMQIERQRAYIEKRKDDFIPAQLAHEQSKLLRLERELEKLKATEDALSDALIKELSLQAAIAESRTIHSPAARLAARNKKRRERARQIFLEKSKARYAK